MGRLKVGVLISGRGSNMLALAEACAAADFPAEIVLVLSDSPDAGGLAAAAQRGIATSAIDRKAHRTKAEFEAAVDAALHAAGVELICLAGFMRVLSADFVGSWHDRILNVHPSLLPAFPGLHTHERALAAGVRLAGCTVHVVRPVVDDGPILVQAAVPVLDGDDAAALAARILVEEHRCYPMALRWVAEGRVTIEANRARIADAAAGTGALRNPL
jgi:phosphoribosylglycinamide formyltransferase-1